VIDPKMGMDTVNDVFIVAGKIIAIGAGPDGFRPTK